MTATEQALREQYAASGIALFGISFQAAMNDPGMSISLQCGAKAAAKASQYNQSRPHWAETEH